MIYEHMIKEANPEPDFVELMLGYVGMILP